jgi:predicted GIY-YIG superfamily endonuclease
MTGIYFLLNRGRVVYIGQSIYIPRRITEHRDKKFSAFRAIECSLDKLNFYEYRWIKKFRPKYNKNGY